MDRNNFSCARCGACCKVLTKVTLEDIRRIAKKQSNFVQSDPSGKTPHLYLKTDNKGWCIFLSKNIIGGYSCRIYDDRPEVCKAYPFIHAKSVDDCIPKTAISRIAKRA